MIKNNLFKFEYNFFLMKIRKIISFFIFISGTKKLQYGTIYNSTNFHKSKNGPDLLLELLIVKKAERFFMKQTLADTYIMRI